MVATPEASWRSLSASMVAVPESSPCDVGPAEAGAVGASSRIVPSASTTRAESIRPLIAPYRGKRLPDEFLPIMPPTVVTPLFAGSTPSERVRRPRCSSNCAATTPGCTRTSSPSVCRMRRRKRPQSMTTPGPSEPPATLEPAPRGCTGIWRSAAHRTVAATSSVVRGRTTASGQTSLTLASLA